MQHDVHTRGPATDELADAELDCVNGGQSGLVQLGQDIAAIANYAAHKPIKTHATTLNGAGPDSRSEAHGCRAVFGDRSCDSASVARSIL